MMDVNEFLVYFDNLANECLNRFNVPSFALGIIKDDEIIFQKGYSKQENGSVPNEFTKFAIGSCSKAFTATLACMLADEGKLDLDKPLNSYLPDISFYDDFTTKHCTMRDLLTHRSGIPGNDFAMHEADFTRSELAHNLKYFKPNKSFRSAYQYNNMGYILAGYVLERVRGKTWEELLEEKILNPLKMTRTSPYVCDLKDDDNKALPHHPKGDTYERCAYYDLNEDKNKHQALAIGPAGSMISCVNDMLKWVKFNLHNFKIDDNSLLSEKMAKEIHQPQMIVNHSLFGKRDDVNCYGLGWDVSMYRNHKFIMHTGSINGYCCATTMMPDLNLGFVIYTNTSSTMCRFPLIEAVYDYFLGCELEVETERFLDWEKQNSDDSIYSELLAGKQVLNTTPTHDLNSFVGDYQTEGYQTLKITLVNDKLHYELNHHEGTLKHYHYNTFVIESNSDFIPLGFPFTFNVGPSGNIEKLNIHFNVEDGCDDVVFNKYVE